MNNTTRSQYEDEEKRLRGWIRGLEDELHRCRTMETASAHALDTLRQDLGLDLIRDEHPSQLVTRIMQYIDDNMDGG